MRLRRLAFTAGLALMLAACQAKATPAAPTAAPAIGGQPLPPQPTQAPTPLPVITPETVTAQQITQRLDPFGSPDCQPPCYNGLTPGSSTLTDALAFYARLGIGISDFVPGDIQRAVTGNGNLRASLMRATDISQALDSGYTPPETNVFMHDGKVQYIYTRYETYAPALDAARVLSTLGAPDKVGLALIFTNDPNTPSNFVLQLVYSAKQTGFSYLGSTKGDAAAQQTCLNGTAVRETLIGVFAPDLAPFSDNPSTPRILQLYDSTGISPADFANGIASSGCINIPADKWLQWRPQ